MGRDCVPTPHGDLAYAALLERGERDLKQMEVEMALRHVLEFSLLRPEWRGLHARFTTRLRCTT